MPKEDTVPNSWWRVLVLEKGFHLRQIRRLILLMIIMIFISTLCLGIFYSHILNILISGDMPAYFLPEDMLSIDAKLPGLQSTLLSWVLGMLCINVFITVILGVYITHKLGSPLYHFKCAAQAIGNGKLSTDIHLDKGDEFKDLAEGLNSAVARVQLMIMMVKENMQTLEQATAGTDSPEIKEAIQGCHEALDYFETVDPTTLQSKSS